MDSLESVQLKLPTVFKLVADWLNYGMKKIAWMNHSICMHCEKGDILQYLWYYGDARNLECCIQGFYNFRTKLEDDDEEKRHHQTLSRKFLFMNGLLVVV